MQIFGLQELGNGTLTRFSKSSAHKLCTQLYRSPSPMAAINKTSSVGSRRQQDNAHPRKFISTQRSLHKRRSHKQGAELSQLRYLILCRLFESTNSFPQNKRPLLGDSSDKPLLLESELGDSRSTSTRTANAAAFLKQTRISSSTATLPGPFGSQPNTLSGLMNYQKANKEYKLSWFTSCPQHLHQPQSRTSYSLYGSFGKLEVTRGSTDAIGLLCTTTAYRSSRSREQ